MDALEDLHLSGKYDRIVVAAQASVRSSPMICFVPTIVALTKTYLIHKRSVPTSK